MKKRVDDNGAMGNADRTPREKRATSVRKVSAELLERNLSTTRSLINAMGHLALLLDRNGVIIAANNTVAKVLDKPIEQLIGARISEFLPDEIFQVWRERWRYINKNDDRKLLFTEQVGGRVYEVSLHPMFDAAGQLSEVTVFGSDITEQKQAEEALRRSRQDWMTIFQAIGHPTMVLDPSQGILQANQAVCRILGKTEAELIGMRCYTLHHALEGKGAPEGCPMRRVLVSGKIETVEMELEGPGGHFIVSCTPVLDDEGRLQKIIHVATDITERKHAEEEKKKLEQQMNQILKMEAIGTLAGGIAHDFNNILMGLQGHISMLLYDMKTDHPHRMKLENMQSYIKRGADLTKQLLGFARGGKYDVKPTCMNELLGKSADLFGRTRKEIFIYRSFAEDLWNVEVDQGQMDQVFLNLFINASQAMPGGGSLDLQTENVVFGDQDLKPVGLPPGRYVKVTVTDDGVGMDKKTLERIFEPFFTTKPKGTGSGLGMASVYGIVKNHDGGIHVYSEPEKGTSIHIYLPAKVSLPVAHHAREEKILTGHETILLVDDESLNISVMMEMLEMLHYRVLPAGSGQEAVAVYREKGREIDLVILDMIMPGISGGRTFDILREINPDVDVILASGYSAESGARTIINRGCRGFIQKPFLLKELSRKVREVLDRRQQRACA